MTSKSRVSKKKVLVASLALLTMGLGGSIATGAYFTDTKTVTNNKLTAGTVLLGGTDFGNINTSTPVTFSNVLPVADKDVTSKAQSFVVAVRNNGTASIDWNGVVSLTSSDFAKQVKVQYKTEQGAWSTSTTLDALNGTKITSGTSILAGSSDSIQFRAWLPAETDNSAQAKTVSFTLTVNAIQAGASQS